MTDVKLMLGDCLELMKDIPDGSVDLILTDPPYGTTACKWDSIIPLEPMWEQLKRVIKPKGAIVMTASQPFTTTLISSNIKMFKYCWVWEKNSGTNFMHSKHQPLKCHEDLVVFSLGGAAQGSKNAMEYNRQMTDGEPYNRGFVGGKRKLLSKGMNGAVINNTSGKRCPRSVVKFNRVQRGVHPTQKPVDLMEYMIKTYTLEGETVLDFTMGSGTTGVAAKNLNRSFIGIELDEGYYNIAKERIEKVE